MSEETPPPKPVSLPPQTYVIMPKDFRLELNNRDGMMNLLWEEYFTEEEAAAFGIDLQQAKEKTMELIDQLMKRLDQDPNMDSDYALLTPKMEIRDDQLIGTYNLQNVRKAEIMAGILAGMAAELIGAWTRIGVDDRQREKFHQHLEQMFHQTRTPEEMRDGHTWRPDFVMVTCSRCGPVQLDSKTDGLSDYWTGQCQCNSWSIYKGARVVPANVPPANLERL